MVSVKKLYFVLVKGAGHDTPPQNTYSFCIIVILLFVELSIQPSLIPQLLPKHLQSTVPKRSTNSGPGGEGGAAAAASSSETSRVGTGTITNSNNAGNVASTNTAPIAVAAPTG